MATIYDVISEYQSQDGVISVSPRWLVCVFPFENQITFDRTKLGSEDGAVSTEMDAEAAVATKVPLIIKSDCIQLTTNTSKNSHLATLSATLLNGEHNYIREIMPGDWIMAWIRNTQEDIDDIAARLTRLEPCNRFTDGFKFIGRVQSARKHGQIERGSGVMRTRHYIQAVGFKELDSNIFFEPAFARTYRDIGSFIKVGLNKEISDFLINGAIDVNQAIPTLLKILVGEGVPTSLSDPSKDIASLPNTPLSTVGLDAPFAYVVPSAVASVLGAEATAKQGIASYADILQLIMGRQRYSTQNDAIGLDQIDPSNFAPLGLSGDSNHRTTGIEMLGKFIPQIPHFSNQPIWSILSQYLNPAVNEMYTCLRVTLEGSIMPHLIVRQLPFSTPIFSQGNDEVTPFHELPRWRIDPRMVYSYEVGRSNAMRFNFIHVYGHAAQAEASYAYVDALTRFPPIRDGIDIQRSGLHGEFIDVGCSIDDKSKDPGKWMEIRSDFQMGLHLTLNGSIHMQGIQGPICEGDNLEFDDVVFHIESVVHNCTVGGDGRHTFETIVNVTHGMRSDSTDPENADLLYPGLSKKIVDLSSLDPKRSYEGKDKA